MTRGIFVYDDYPFLYESDGQIRVDGPGVICKYDGGDPKTLLPYIEYHTPLTTLAATDNALKRLESVENYQAFLYVRLFYCDGKVFVAVEQPSRPEEVVFEMSAIGVDESLRVTVFQVVGFRVVPITMKASALGGKKFKWT